MRSLYLIQQVDLNMLTVILLSGYRMLVAYPPWARTDHKPFSVKPKTEKALVWIARLPLLPGITCMAAAGQVKPASIA